MACIWILTWPLLLKRMLVTTSFESGWLLSMCGCSVNAAIALFWLIIESVSISWWLHLFSLKTSDEILTLVSTWINTRNFLNICFDLEICSSN
jgi:hypothetical protein